MLDKFMLALVSIVKLEIGCFEAQPLSQMYNVTAKTDTFQLLWDRKWGSADGHLGNVFNVGQPL
jgi:hypothetical protein